MFIKTIFKVKLIDLEILYQNAIYILHILIQQNLLIFGEKMLSPELQGCVT